MNLYRISASFGLLFASLCSTLLADSGSETVQTIVTRNGKVYEKCRIFESYPDGVMFFHKHGGAKILYADMSAESREQLGYDHKKEAAYNKRIAERERLAAALKAGFVEDLPDMPLAGPPGYPSGPGQGWEGCAGVPGIWPWLPENSRELRKGGTPYIWRQGGFTSQGNDRDRVQSNRFVDRPPLRSAICRGVGPPSGFFPYREFFAVPPLGASLGALRGRSR